MEDKIKKQYYDRLTTRLNTNGEMFIDQYQEGSGKELGGKFWSENSSSRLAFDLYSWIAKEQSVHSFQFEKKLPGVICSKHGPAGVPNMDVFFETTNDIVFIESKYLEGASLAYTNGKKPSLSRAYWHKGVYGNMEPKKRFYGREDIAKHFSSFCEIIQKKINLIRKNKWKWFDVKQETCHIFGVIFYLLGAEYKNTQGVLKEQHLDKKVHLCNIIWKCENDNFDIDKESLPFFFEEQAKQLVKDCIGSSVEFDFHIMTVQDLLKETDFYGLDFTKAKAFGLDCSLNELMNQYDRKKKRGNY